MVQKLILKADPSTGLSAINDVLVAPLTMSLSKAVGTLAFPNDIFNASKKVEVGRLDSDLKLQASDVRFENLVNAHTWWKRKTISL